jgi:predicted nucleic acid-binding protein
MNAAVIDTDVVSMIFKGDSRALRYRGHISGRLLGISFMTLAELERWPLERNWASSRKAELTQHLTKYVVLPASRELCAKWAEVSWEARRYSASASSDSIHSRKCWQCSRMLGIPTAAAA